MNDWEPEQLDPAYQEAWAILERLACAGSPSPRESGDSSPPSNGADTRGGRRTVPPAWAEQTLRSLLEVLQDALVVIDRDGTIVLVNARTEEMFGYDRDELLGQAVELLVPERLRRAHVAHRTAYFAAPHGRPMGADLDELWGRRKDGTEFPVEISLTPLETEHGTLVTSCVRDITARKRAEAKFRTLVENIPAVTFLAPLDESVPEFYVSPQIERLLGFSQKEWLEDPVLWHRQLHPDDRDRWNVDFAPTCAEGVPFHSVYRFLAKDGRVVWVHGSAQLVRDADGRPLFLQGVAFDVTTLEEAKQALSRLNTELDERVRQRTEELEERTDELETFAYVASHDLREPLRTLVNYPQRLIKHYAGKLDEQADDWINRIINGADRMRKLIDDLAQYSRILRRDRVLVPVDCAEVFEQARAALGAALQQSGAELTAGALPRVMGNEQQLMLLFMNLIGNAVKFCCPDQPVRVEVGCRRDGDGWLFWVRDNGIGIEPKYLQRIFGLGERLHPASRYPGTGFGLAICEKIVTRHAGHIWAESELGQGSTFYFTLPDAPPAG